MPGVTLCWCLAYDWRFAVHSIAHAWPAADKIVLGLDRYRKTWTGRPFELDMGEFLLQMYRAVRERGHDTGTVVQIVEEDFYNDAKLGPFETCVAERNVLSLKAGPGDWIVQLDSDELLQDASGFGRWLRNHDAGGYVTVELVNIWKVIGDTALVVDIEDQRPICTRKPNAYVRPRWTMEPYGVVAPFKAIHWTLGGRTRDEIEEKMRSWGRAGQRDPKEFLALWDSVTLANYGEDRYLSPCADERAWRRLRAVPLSQLGPMP